jgi:hypothetical protein
MATPKAFLSTRRTASDAAAAELQQHATRFMRRVAQDLRLSSTEFEIAVKRGTVKRRQRITLSTASFFLDVHDTEPGKSVAITFRTRREAADLTGGGENSVSVEQLGTADGYAALLSSLKLTQGLSISRYGSAQTHRRSAHF